MRKLILTILLMLAPASIQAQTTNVHAGLSVGPPGPGFSGLIYGATVGTDIKASNRLVASLDLDLLRVRKTVGGAGYQVNGRETLRGYVKPKFFVQGGLVEQHYSVTQFSKTSVQLLGGAGYGTPSETLAINYRHDLTSNNRQRIVEGNFSYYCDKHLFLRLTTAVSWFKTSVGGSPGFSVLGSIGMHW